MKRAKLLLLSVAALGLSGAPAISGAVPQGAKQDVQDAGKSVGHAAKKSGSAVKKGTKKGVNTGAKETKKGANKVEEKTQP